MPKKKKGRGGKRPGAGRKRTGNVRVTITVKKITFTKIDKLSKEGKLWKRRGQVVDELLNPISVKGAEFLDLALS